MTYDSSRFSEKGLFISIVIFLFFLPISEAIKNISLAFMLVFFITQLINSKVSISKDVINIAIILHLVVVAIGIWVGVNPEESLKQSADLIKITLVFIIFREMNMGLMDIRVIWLSVFIGLIVAVTMGEYNYFILNADFLKLKSVGSVNRSATYLVYVFIAALVIFLTERKGGFRNITMLTVILSCLGIVLGGSRMAIYTLPIIIGLLVFPFNKIRWQSFATILLVFGLFAALANVMFDGSRVVNKMNTGFDDLPRVQIWISSFYIWLEHNIWFGIGLGNSIAFDVRNFFGEEALTDFINNPHNVYLDMLLERGLLGLVTFLVFIGAIFQRSYKLLDNDRALNVMSCLIVLVILGMGLANITFRYEFALLAMAIMGLGLNKTIRQN